MGVEYPCGTIHRYSNIQAFFIIFISYKALINIQSIKPKYIIISSIILIITWILVNYRLEYFNDIIFQLDIKIIIALFIIFCIILKFNNPLYYKNGLIIILLIHLINLTYHTYFVLDSQRSCLTAYSIKNFTNYVEIGKNALSYIKKADDGFYRIEIPISFIDNKNIFYNNSSMLLNYNSISHYSSLGEIKLKDFYRNIGYFSLSYNNIGIAYKDTMSLFPQMLTGIKYIITDNILSEPYKKIKTIVNKKDRFYIYKNPYSLPVAFLIDNNEKLYSYLEFKTLSQYQNSLAKILSKKDNGNIYNVLITKNIKINETERKNSFQKFSYKINNQPSDRLFLEIYENPIKNLFYNGNKVNSHSEFSIFQTIYLPNNNYNRDINLLFKYYDEPYDIDNYDISIINENLDILEKYYNDLAKSPCELTKITSSHLKGKFNADGNNKLIFMTIPYDEGWKIKINGKKRKAIKVFDAMMAVPVENGENEIEMIYIPKGFNIGFIISLISLLFIIFGYRSKYR